MIVTSVLLVVAAGVLLGLGLVKLDETMLYASIGVSVLAAVTLAIGVRRLVALRAGRGLIAVRVGPAGVGPGGAPATAALVVDATVGPQAVGQPVSRPVGRATPRPVGRATPPPHARAGAVVDGVLVAEAADRDVGALAAQDSAGRADEPAEEVVTQRDADRISQVTTEVLVIDGRPRYHVEGCVQLLGLEPEWLPAPEAIELGFTPCAECRPASTLLR
jgi:hypothetical protein